MKNKIYFTIITAPLVCINLLFAGESNDSPTNKIPQKNFVYNKIYDDFGYVELSTYFNLDPEDSLLVIGTGNVSYDIKKRLLGIPNPTVTLENNLTFDRSKIKRPDIVGNCFYIRDINKIDQQFDVIYFTHVGFGFAGYQTADVLEIYYSLLNEGGIFLYKTEVFGNKDAHALEKKYQSKVGTTFEEFHTEALKIAGLEIVAIITRKEPHYGSIDDDCISKMIIAKRPLKNSIN